MQQTSGSDFIVTAPFARMFWNAASAVRQLEGSEDREAIIEQIDELCMYAMERGPIASRAMQLLQDIAWSTAWSEFARRKAGVAIGDALRVRAVP